MKTQKELEALRDEVKALKTKLAELTEEELKQVTGGQMAAEVFAGGAAPFPFDVPTQPGPYAPHFYKNMVEDTAKERLPGRR